MSTQKKSKIIPITHMPEISGMYEETKYGILCVKVKDESSRNCMKYVAIAVILSDKDNEYY